MIPMLREIADDVVRRRHGFSELFDSVVEVRHEEFCLRPSDGRVTATSRGDHARLDYDVVGDECVPDVFPHFVVDITAGDYGRSQFVDQMMSNDARLHAGPGDREVHVRRETDRMLVGIAGFEDQDQREVDILSLVAQGAEDVADASCAKVAPRFEGRVDDGHDFSKDISDLFSR